MMNIAVVSDLHGLRPRFEKVKKLLDEGMKKLRIGSRAITEFIKNKDPWITIHGHSHSVVDRMKGRFVFDIGDSKSVLVGAGNDPNTLNFLTLDIKNRVFERHRI